MDFTLDAALTRFQDDRHHRQRLEQISKRHKSEYCSPPDTVRYLNQLQQGSTNFQKKRMRDISYENQKILRSIKDIYDGKRSSSVNFGLKYITDSLSPKSLHYPFKKLEALRIQQENAALAKRLENKQSHLSARKMKSEFRRTQQYKKQLSKANFAKRLKQIGQCWTYKPSQTMQVAHPLKAARAPSIPEIEEHIVVEESSLAPSASKRLQKAYDCQLPRFTSNN